MASKKRKNDDGDTIGFGEPSAHPHGPLADDEETEEDDEETKTDEDEEEDDSEDDEELEDHGYHTVDFDNDEGGSF